jgi:outer membrane protein OmpU
MRKVLLATTALVAMTGYAAADVSLAAYYEFGYTSSSDDRTDASADQDAMFSDAEYHITFSETTDSGLTFSAKYELEGQASTEATRSASQIDEASLTISSAEMGSLVLGNNDMASASFQTWLPSSRGAATADDHQFTIKNKGGTVLASAAGLTPLSNGATYGDTLTTAYFTPSLGGAKIGISITDSGTEEDTSMGFSYTGDFAGSAFTLTGATWSDNQSTEIDNVSFGVSFSVGGADVALSTSTTESGTTYDTTTSGAGIGFSLAEGMNVYAAMAKSEDDVSSDTLDTVSISMDYSIAPGLSFAAAMNTYSYEDASASTSNNDADEIVVSIQANF